MGVQCECSNGVMNTGATNNVRKIANSGKLLIVPLYKADGTATKITSSDTLNQAFFAGKVAATNINERWFPTPILKNVTDVRADPVKETYSDGNGAIVQNGIKTFTGWLVGQSSKMVQQINQFSCLPYGVYGIDNCGNLVGQIDSNGDLLPIRIFNQSLEARLIQASDTEAAKVQVMFEYDQALTQDSKLRMIKASELGGANLLSLNGLIDLTGIITNPAATSLNVNLTIDYDEVFTDEPVEGLPIAAFTLFNVTDNAAVTVSGLSDLGDGDYTLTYASQTAGDILRLSVIYGGKELKPITTTIPV